MSSPKGSPRLNEPRASITDDVPSTTLSPATRPTSPNRAGPYASRLLSNLSERSRRGSTSPLRDEWHFENKDDVQITDRKLPSWGRRQQHQPRLGWKSKWGKHGKTGRVLIVDYVKAELSKEGMRKVASREIHHLETLEELYNKPDKNDIPALRLFHIQNAEWAVEFMVKKFAISTKSIVGNDFAQYVSYARPEIKGKRPLLRGRSWAPQHDNYRGVNKMAFGLDYLKLYPSIDPISGGMHTGKFMELNAFDDLTDTAHYGFDACPQRFSCYIQKEEEIFDAAQGMDVDNPYPDGIDQFDNGNVIIIFENSKSKKITDTMITARGDLEQRWRRLPFHIAADQHEVTSNDDLALECMKYILRDLWDGLANSWTIFLDQADHHVAILEEKIYEQPADESRADEIWKNSSNWLKVERLMYTHLTLLKQLNTSFREYIEDRDEDGWLDIQVDTFEGLLQRVAENLVKPTDSLSDLMYKSVGIRDTRHSLDLSYSMWRLSWITFVFLPLNFTTSAFGMNIDILANNPLYTWYFVFSVPLVVLVFLTYWVFKHLFMQARQTPYSRGIYERFFHGMAERYPLLWSRAGPRDTVRLKPFWQRIQWHLIQRWNEPEKTITNPVGTEDDQFDGLGTWRHLKKVMTRRWTAELNATSIIAVEPEAQSPVIMPLGDKYAKPTAVESLDQVICEADINSFELKPAIPPSQPQNLLPLPGQDTVSTRGGGSPRSRFSFISTGSRDRRSSYGSQDSSGVMVEERNEDWLCDRRKKRKRDEKNKE